jgi:hypothetical protein
MHDSAIIVAAAAVLLSTTGGGVVAAAAQGEVCSPPSKERSIDKGESGGGDAMRPLAAAAPACFPSPVLILESLYSHWTGFPSATDKREILLVEDSLVGLLWMFSSSVLESDSVGLSALGVPGSMCPAVKKNTN